MAMLVGEMGANYFITIFKHLAALRKRKKKNLKPCRPCLCKDAGEKDC